MARREALEGTLRGWTECALDPKGALDEARAVGLLDGVDERGKG
jgi:hypothetical protein